MHAWTRVMRVGLGVACLWGQGFLLTALAEGASDTQTVLDHHVQALTQPKMHGRKTRSTGARLAREYIENEFRTSGVVPWAGTKNYELSFGLGKNVVGVIPGSDAAVAKEIVLLSAHYDHLGQDRKGRVCPGACDNASGVAVLLEAARHFGQSPRSTKRTIALAAFDAEEQMLLGSFAFCCRTDVAAAKIVAVVNVDMLGRDFLDTLPNTVFVAGTEQFPDLQAQVRLLGSGANLRVLPIGSDLIGPRSDHVAFETGGFPCLFFSCGTFKDYHEPGDTAARLNYADLEKSAQVILRTVETLANEDIPPVAVGPDCDLEELKSVQTVISELSRDPIKAGLRTNDLKALNALESKVQTLSDTHNYTPQTREDLILQVTRSLGRYFLPFGDQGSATNEGTGWAAVMPYLEHIYLNYHRQLAEGQKQLVAHVLQHPPGLFHGMRLSRYELYDIPDQDISLNQIGSDEFALHALGNSFTLSVQAKPLIWPFDTFQASFAASFEALDCEGSRQDLVDYCLLYVRAQRTNELHTAAIQKVLRTITGAEAAGKYRDWLQARLDQLGFASENDWILACLTNPHPPVVHEALGAAETSNDPQVWNSIRGIMLNRKLRPDVRAQAIQLTEHHRDQPTLIALTQILDDPVPSYDREHSPQLSPGYPLADRMTFQCLRPFLEQTFAQKPDTIGEAALRQLRKATRRNFGPDAQKWKAFLEKSR